MLHYETVTPELKNVLETLMSAPVLDKFCLVGGTSLSLRCGHRFSVDINLFTDAPYDRIDFTPIEQYLEKTFPYYCKTDPTEIVGFGRSYYIGNTKEQAVKLDLFYTDPFIRNIELIDNIRIAHVEDIIAMKVDVVAREGRKKDFWDLHYLLDHYTIPQMISLHKERNPWTHDEKEILSNFVNFETADEMSDPVCFLNKDWDYIKIDFADVITSYENKKI